MRIFDKFKAILGFSSNGEEQDDELDGVDGRAARRPYVNPFKDDDDQPAVPAPAPAPDMTEANEKIKLLRQRLNDSEEQRRALQARSHSLSQRVATLEGELEQLDLEKKSLLNKLKVAQLQYGDSSAVQAEVENITAEFRTKMEVTNAMLNDFRAEATRKSKELEELKVQLEKGNPYEDVLKAKEAELKEKEEEIASLKTQLAEVGDAVQLTEQIEQKLEKFEKVKAKKQQEIANLKQEILDRDKSIADLQAQVQAAQKAQVRLNRREIDTANQIDALKQQNKSLKQELSNLKEELEQAKREPAPEAPTTILDDIDDVDWLHSELDEVISAPENVEPVAEETPAAVEETPAAAEVEAEETPAVVEETPAEAEIEVEETPATVKKHKKEDPEESHQQLSLF